MLGQTILLSQTPWGHNTPLPVEDVLGDHHLLPAQGDHNPGGGSPDPHSLLLWESALNQIPPNPIYGPLLRCECEDNGGIRDITALSW